METMDFQETDWMPETEETFRRRYRILDRLQRAGHAGRRSLGEALAETEGVLRGDIAVLSALGLLNITRGGLSLTARGAEELSRMRSRDPERVRCIEMEERLRRVLGGCRAHVSVSERHLRFYEKRHGGIRPGSWKEAAADLDRPFTRMLEFQDACTAVQGVILSRNGNPLYRDPMTRRSTPGQDAEREKTVPDGDPPVLFGGEGVSGRMLFAAWLYLNPKAMYLLYSEGLEILGAFREEQARRSRNFTEEEFYY